MRRVWPHEFFRIDFDQMIEEAKRQEEIHSANKGEYALVQDMHAYFSNEVLPLIVSNEWMFEAATKFAREYAIECFHFLRLSGWEVYATQKELLRLNDEVVEFLAQAFLAGAAPLAGEIDLPKASDFMGLLDLEKLTGETRQRAMELYEKARDHEILQL